MVRNVYLPIAFAIVSLVEASRNVVINADNNVELEINRQGFERKCEVKDRVDAWVNMKKGFEEAVIVELPQSGKVKVVRESDPSERTLSKKRNWEEIELWQIDRRGGGTCCRDNSVDMTGDDSDKIAESQLDIDNTITQLQTGEFGEEYGFQAWPVDSPLYGLQEDGTQFTDAQAKDLIVRHVRLMRLQMFQVQHALLQGELEPELKRWFGSNDDDWQKARFQVLRTMHLIKKVSERLCFTFVGYSEEGDYLAAIFKGELTKPVNEKECSNVEIGSSFFTKATYQPRPVALESDNSISHRAMVLYHEMTHLVKKYGACSGDESHEKWKQLQGSRGQIGTFDWEYEPGPCIELAKREPEQARSNADSHAFFVTDALYSLIQKDPSMEYGVYGKSGPDVHKFQYTFEDNARAWKSYVEKHPELGIHS